MLRGALGAGALATSSLWLPELSWASGTTIENLVRNPRVAQALDGWVGYAETGSATIARRTDDGLAPATTCAQVTFTSTSSLHRGAALISRTAGTTMPCTAGQVLWVQGAGKLVSGDAGAELWLSVAYLNAAGTFLTEQVLQKVAATPGAWQTLRGFDTAPANATQCYLAVWLAGTKQAGSVLRVTDAMVVAQPDTMPAYFDGDQPGCAWTGTPHASTSTGPAPTPAAPARAGFLVGWNDNAVPQADWTPADDAALNADIGMTVLRVCCDLRGGWITTNTATIDWNLPSARLIDQLANALPANIKLLPIALGAPTWMISPLAQPGNKNPPLATKYADWASICAQMATRWNTKLAGIEIWNEQNIHQFWAPRPSANDYTDLLIAASTAVRAAAPGVRVIVGGLANPADSLQTGDVSIGTFIDQMTARGANGHYDGMAVHPYPGTPRSGQFSDAMRATRAAMARAGNASPLWVNEIGISTTGAAAVTEAQQAAVNRLLYAMLKRDADVQAVCWHTSVSRTGLAPTDSEVGFEFVDHVTRAHKAVYDAVKTELAGEP